MKKDLLLPMTDKVLLVDDGLLTLPTTQMSDSALAS